MTGIEAPIGEDDLQAWVDDRLDPARRARVDAHLADDPELRDRLADDRRRRDALRALLAAKAAEPIPPRLRLAALGAEMRRRRARRFATAAAALLLFAGGVGVGALATRALAPEPRPTLVAQTTATTTLTDEAGAAYRTYVVEVAHPVEVDASREAHLMQWLSKRLGRRLAAPDLGRFGWHLIGGRLLPGDHGAAAQLMYEDAGGRRLTVYVQASSGEETAFRFRQAGEVATCVWIDAGFGFAVTAAMDREQMQAIAEVVYHGFEAVAGAPPGKG